MPDWKPLSVRRYVETAGEVDCTCACAKRSVPANRTSPVRGGVWPICETDGVNATWNTGNSLIVLARPASAADHAGG